MVLPGIQALFGFQLIAVFNQGFNEKLSTAQQQLHFVSIILTVCAVALVNDSGCSSSANRSISSDPLVHGLQYNAVAPEYVSSRAKHIFGALHYRPNYHRVILAQFARCRGSFTFILFPMGFAA